MLEALQIEETRLYIKNSLIDFCDNIKEWEIIICITHLQNFLKQNSLYDKI